MVIITDCFLFTIDEWLAVIIVRWSKKVKKAQYFSKPPLDHLQLKLSTIFWQFLGHFCTLYRPLVWDLTNYQMFTIFWSNLLFLGEILRHLPHWCSLCREDFGHNKGANFFLCTSLLLSCPNLLFYCWVRQRFYSCPTLRKVKEN